VGAGAEEGAAIPGFSAAGAEHQLAIEADLAAGLDAANVERHFRFLTEEPHVAGSERNYQLALYTRDRFLEYGLEDVQLLRYDVLLPWPTEVRVQMLAPEVYEPTLREAGVAVDKDSWDANVGPTYIGMSGSGDVTGDVIYAHSGNPEDYDWLESQGIDPRGKIAVVRYSDPYSYRGFKAWEAERRGVKALLIYSDPMEDGFKKGEVFPDGPWGPKSHIQRGAITYDFIVPGDPLTPGWASVEGARRIPVGEARSVPGIIAVPMSWGEMQPILEALGGPVAPYDWQGGLPITYHAGPGPAKLRVVVRMDDKIRSIWVVTGSIRGADLPEESVVLGNHRDAWVYGGVDPSSGSATQLELARLLGRLANGGHRPRRTVTLASWDAEEWHLTGSTEWGEQFAKSLGEGCVAYLNVDSSTAGPEFLASAVASLSSTVETVARDVIDPNSRRSLLEAWRRRVGSPEDGEARLVDNELGSGSDYTVFLNFLGVPVVDMVFDGPYGVYHSQYDNLLWMERFGDPGYRYMTAMAEVWGRMGLRLANAEVLPYDFERYARTVGGFIERLAELPGAAEHLDLTEARSATAGWESAAGRARETAAGWLSAGRAEAAGGDRLQEFNRHLLEVERRLLIPAGIPGRPWFKHALYAPRYTYAALSLPGVVEAAERADWMAANAQLAVVAERLRAAAAELDAATSAGGAP
jgi:N-acetylated-alpha-linked acidic dipeptidase